MSIIYNLVDTLLMNNNEEVIYSYIKNKKKKIIFDVGCFRGKFTEKIIKIDKKTNNKSKFYLFDPNPKVPNYINKLLKQFKTISFTQQGFNSRIVKKIFHLNNFFEASGSSFQTILKNDKKWNLSRRFFLRFINILSFKKLENFTKINVCADTIDNFCNKKGIKKIDLLKIDTEGHEEFILQGALKYLKKNKINVIYTEVLEKKKKFEKKKKKIIEYLKKYNFDFIKEYPIKSVSIFSNLKSSDILFLNKKF